MKIINNKTINMADNQDPRNRIVDLSQTAMYIPNMYGRPRRPLKGDVNRDGIISEKDIEILEAYIKGNYHNIERNQADIFVDGSINEMDVNVLNSFGDYFVVKFLNLRNSDLVLTFSHFDFLDVSSTFKTTIDLWNNSVVTCKPNEEGIIKFKMNYSNGSWYDGTQSQMFRAFAMTKNLGPMSLDNLLTDNDQQKIDYIILPSKLQALTYLTGGSFDKIKFLGNLKVLDTCATSGKTFDSVVLNNLTNISTSFMGLRSNIVKLNKVSYITNNAFAGTSILNLDLNEVYANYSVFLAINSSNIKGERLNISGCLFTGSGQFTGSKFKIVNISGSTITTGFPDDTFDELTISDSTLGNKCFSRLTADKLTIKNCKMDRSSIFDSHKAKIIEIDGLSLTTSGYTYAFTEATTGGNLEKISISNATVNDIFLNVYNGGLNYPDVNVENCKICLIFDYSGGVSYIRNATLKNSELDYVYWQQAQNVNIDSCTIESLSRNTNSYYEIHTEWSLPKLKAVNSTIGFYMTAFKEVYLKDCVITNWSISGAAYLRKELCNKLEFDNVTCQNIINAYLYNFADIHIKGESDIPFYFRYSKVDNKIPTTIIVGETENALNIYDWYQEDGNNLTELPKCVYIKKGTINYLTSGGLIMQPDIALGKDCNGIRRSKNRGYFYCNFVYFRPDWDKTVLPENFLDGLSYNSDVNVYNLFVILPDSIEYFRPYSLGNSDSVSTQVWKNFVFGPNVRGVDGNVYTATYNKGTSYIIFTGTRPPLFTDSGLQFDGTNIFVPDESITEYQINMSAVTTIPIKGISELPKTVADYLEASRARIEKNEKIISDFGYE